MFGPKIHARSGLWSWVQQSVSLEKKGNTTSKTPTLKFHSKHPWKVIHRNRRKGRQACQSPSNFQGLLLLNFGSATRPWGHFYIWGSEVVGQRGARWLGVIGMNYQGGGPTHVFFWIFFTPKIGGRFEAILAWVATNYFNPIETWICFSDYRLLSTMENIPIFQFFKNAHFPVFHREGNWAVANTWNPKQPFINGCFNWMMNQIFTYKNGWKSPNFHPFINGWPWGSRYSKWALKNRSFKGWKRFNLDFFKELLPWPWDTKVCHTPVTPKKKSQGTRL